MNSVLNVSAYRFVAIDDPHALRATLLERARSLDLKGTILLAPEGINLFLAGAPEAVRGLVAFLGLEARESWSGTQPFRKLLVKVKRETIRMDHPAIVPAAGRAPAVDARTVQRWLDRGTDDAGRPVVMLDTRNAFEVDHGTFEGAVDWRLSRFGEFPAAARARAAQLQGATVVSFCTGGIRCEKAALYLHECGLEHVFQLEGGILGYFEEVGGAHFRGRCFVFDERETLAPVRAAPGPGRSDPA